MPRPGSACSSYLVRGGDAAVLFDLGSGALGKLQTAIEYPRLDAIVISHMHADHFFDLVPLRYGLKYGPLSRADRMPLWLPPGGGAALVALADLVGHGNADFFTELFDVREYDEAQPLQIKSLSLTFRGTRHYVDAYAIRAEHGDASIVFSADTAPCDAVVEHARASSMFLCEVGLGLGSEEGERGHTSAREAGEMAERAGVGRLVLTHYNAGASPRALVDAAASRFAGPITLAYDGLEISA